MSFVEDQADSRRVAILAAIRATQLDLGATSEVFLRKLAQHGYAVTPKGLEDQLAKAIVSEAFLLTQPNRGDVFGWIDDHAEQLVRAAIAKATTV